MSIAAERRGDAQWLARLTLPKAGQWTLGLGIAISDTDKVSIQAPIVIK
jgi:copper transport protein